MLKYLLILFGIIYLSGIVSSIIKIAETVSLLETLEKYLQSATVESYASFTPHEDYFPARRALLLRYPQIVHHLGVNCPNLAYGQPDNEIYANATRICNDLSMQRNFYLSGFIRSFNPRMAFWKLLRIPSTIVRGMGFSPSAKSSKFINIFGWFGTELFNRFFNMYAVEIKAFINSFFH